MSVMVSNLSLGFQLILAGSATEIICVNMIPGRKHTEKTLTLSMSRYNVLVYMWLRLFVTLRHLCEPDYVRCVS